jgi:hypothetical protein
MNGKALAVFESPSNLAVLGGRVRAGLTAYAHALNGALTHAFAVGEALHEAKALCGYGRWLPWLEAECGGLSAKTATDYMRLAQHRARIEAEISNRQRAADLSLRAALRLVGSGRLSQRPRKPSTSPTAVWKGVWKASPAAERKDLIAAIPLTEWLEAMPGSWRAEIVDRVDGLRAAQAKPVAAYVIH